MSRNLYAEAARDMARNAFTSKSDHICRQKIALRQSNLEDGVLKHAASRGRVHPRQQTCSHEISQSAMTLRYPSQERED